MSDASLPTNLDGVVRWFFIGTIVFALGFEGVTMLLEAKFILSLASFVMAAVLLGVMVYMPWLPGIVLAGSFGLPLIFLGVVEFCKKRKLGGRTMLLTGVGMMIVALVVAVVGGAILYSSVMPIALGESTATQPEGKPDDELQRQLQSERDARATLDRQLAATRKELQEALVQRDANKAAAENRPSQAIAPPEQEERMVQLFGAEPAVEGRLTKKKRKH